MRNQYTIYDHTQTKNAMPEEPLSRPNKNTLWDSSNLKEYGREFQASKALTANDRCIASLRRTGGTNPLVRSELEK
jgi:hypothetical protein